MPGLECLLKQFVFERDFYFRKKRTLMLTFNFDSQNCQKFCALICRNLPKNDLKMSWLQVWKMRWGRVLIKTRNDLKRPTASKKQPETTYNDLKRPVANKKRPGNDLQRARNNLKRPTTSKTQPTTTRAYLQRAKEKTRSNQQQPHFEIILQYGAIGSLV